MYDVVVYVKGHCEHRFGGWAALLTYGENHRFISGNQPDTTHNRMELTAAIEALSALKEPCNVTLYSNNTYLTNLNPGTANDDLWNALIDISKQHNAKFLHMKKATNVPEMNHTDDLAYQEVLEAKAQSELS